MSDKSKLVYKVLHVFVDSDYPGWFHSVCRTRYSISYSRGVVARGPIHRSKLFCFETLEHACDFIHGEFWLHGASIIVSGPGTDCSACVERARWSAEYVDYWDGGIEMDGTCRAPMGTVLVSTFTPETLVDIYHEGRAGFDEKAIRAAWEAS